jgi:hypothetical protein
MLNKLDLKNFDEVVRDYNFKELVAEESPAEIVHAFYNKVRI